MKGVNTFQYCSYNGSKKYFYGSDDFKLILMSHNATKTCLLFIWYWMFINIRIMHSYIITFNWNSTSFISERCFKNFILAYLYFFISCSPISKLLNFLIKTWATNETYTLANGHNLIPWQVILKTNFMVNGLLHAMFPISNVPIATRANQTITLKQCIRLHRQA